MNEQKVCKYFRSGTCIAQGELRVMCQIPSMFERCHAYKNPEFDRITELQHTVLHILERIQLHSHLDKNQGLVMILEKEIKELKEKMRIVREE